MQNSQRGGTDRSGFGDQFATVAWRVFLVGIAACLSLGPMTKGVQPGANVIKRRVVVAQTITLRSGNGTTLAFLRSFGPDRNAARIL